MAKAFALNRHSLTRKITGCYKATLENPHVRGFLVTFGNKRVLIHWRNKDYTLFPSELEAILKNAAQRRKVSLEGDSTLKLIAIDPQGGAEDFLVGNVVVHVTCRIKVGDPNNANFIPSVTFGDLPSWWALVRMIAHPEFRLLDQTGVQTVSLTEVTPCSITCEVISGSEEGGYVQVRPLVYGLSGEPAYAFKRNARMLVPADRLPETGRVEFFLHRMEADSTFTARFLNLLKEDTPSSMG